MAKKADLKSWIQQMFDISAWKMTDTTTVTFFVALLAIT